MFYYTPDYALAIPFQKFHDSSSCSIYSTRHPEKFGLMWTFQSSPLRSHVNSFLSLCYLSFSLCFLSPLPLARAFFPRTIPVSERESMGVMGRYHMEFSRKSGSITTNGHFCGVSELGLEWDYCCLLVRSLILLGFYGSFRFPMMMMVVCVGVFAMIC